MGWRHQPMHWHIYLLSIHRPPFLPSIPRTLHHHEITQYTHFAVGGFPSIQYSPRQLPFHFVYLRLSSAFDSPFLSPLHIFFFPRSCSLFFPVHSPALVHAWPFLLRFFPVLQEQLGGPLVLRPAIDRMHMSYRPKPGVAICTHLAAQLINLIPTFLSHHPFLPNP